MLPFSKTFCTMAIQKEGWSGYLTWKVVDVGGSFGKKNTHKNIIEVTGGLLYKND